MKEILKITLVLLFAMVATATYAQTKNDDDKSDEYSDGEPFEESWTDKLVFGGNALPGYSNGWILELSPFVGYKLTNSTIAGVGINYFYRSYRNPFFQNSPKQIYRTYGGRAFVMQNLAFGLFAQAEYDYTFLNYKEKDIFDNVTGSYQTQAPGFLIGGGYSQNAGRIGYNMMVLYDTLYSTTTSARTSPWVIRGGIVFGM